MPLKLTPYVAKLVFRKFSLIAVPKGEGLQAALSVLSDSEKYKATMREAVQWVEDALKAVRSAPDNPYESDEEIAKAIFDKVEK